MPIQSAETQAKSYRYLRIAMVGLLLALAAAVFYQSSTQDSFLASVSAYYYTPAQAVFVGALIGLGACMIALQGTNYAEDVFLNLGGMFALVVAVVPTGRGADFDTAVRACRESGGTLLTHQASKNLDCPGMLALRDATRANVENNMAALLAVGGLALVLAAVFLFKDWTAKRRTPGWRGWVVFLFKDWTVKRGTPGWGWVLGGFLAAVLVWLGGLIALAASVDWLARHAHYIAASGLLLGILAVAGANVHRREEKPTLAVVLRGGVLKAPRRYFYTGVAVAMLVVAGVLIVLWAAFNVISLFWVEILVAFLFVLFWIAQTIELELTARRPGSHSEDQPERLAPGGQVSRTGNPAP
jgi:hypothetical protein